MNKNTPAAAHATPVNLAPDATAGDEAAVVHSGAGAQARLPVGRLRPRGRRRRQAIGKIALLCLGLGLGGGLVSGCGTTRKGSRSASDSAALEQSAGANAGGGDLLSGRDVGVRVDPARQLAHVPQSFIGLSFETSALPWLAGYGSGGGLASMLRSLGGGLLRIGGASTDRFSAWVGRGGRLPSWASVALSSKQLEGVAKLLRAADWEVLLSVGAARTQVAQAAAEVTTARSVFGRHLRAIAIGNEPDRYGKEGVRAAGWSFSDYAAEYREYAARLRTQALAAPDASSGMVVLPWVEGTAAKLQPALLTDHFYPLSSCGGERTSAVGLLDAKVRSDQEKLLARLALIAHRSGRQVLIDESNNISCHGQAGLSNSFAAALWALEWGSEAMTAGIAGVDFHDLLAEPTSYAPLVFAQPALARLDAVPARSGAVLAPAALRANPEWYALLMLSRLCDSQALAASVSGESGLQASAFRLSGGRLAILLVNVEQPGEEPLLVHLVVPAGYHSGSILRLSAPSLAATSQVRLGGAEVGARGGWTPKLPLPRIGSVRGQPAAELAAGSAALLVFDAPVRGGG